jgi:hypothetical protein
MAEPSFSYSVENDKAFQRSIDSAIKKVGSLKIPFKLIRMDFYKSQAMFKLKGPGQYPDFKSEKSKKQKIREVGFAYPLLVRTGKLMRSVTTKNAAGSISEITDFTLTLGTELDYGIYHQSDRPRRKIPLRKFLFIGPEAPRFATSDQMGRLNRWTGIIKEYVDKKLGIE